jgi:hypothetical protein
LARPGPIAGYFLEENAIAGYVVDLDLNEIVPPRFRNITFFILCSR